MSNQPIDIAIIGAGISGLYSGWKLKKKYPSKNIVVFEASKRVGGRLLSVTPPGIPNMVAELGGMRILENNQPLIVKLIKDLNELLPADGQIELYDFPVDQKQNIAYLRGEYLRLMDFSNNPSKVPYNLAFTERGCSPGGIMVNAIEQIVPGITDPDLTDEQRHKMAQAASFAGKELYKQGFWNVLSRVISGEAYLFGRDAGGYTSTLLNWNAADAIPWYLVDFGITPKYKGFKKGYQQVADVTAEFFKKEGGEIRLSSRLDGFTQENGQFNLSVNGETINAAAVILAMPCRSLELLSPACPLLQGADVQELIGSVTPRPLFKLFTTYSSPWWRAAGYTENGTKVPVAAGRSVTDLPIRQTYYWPKNDGTPATDGECMLLATYDDGTNIGFWDGLRPKRSKAWENRQDHSVARNTFKGTDEGVNKDWDEYKAPAGMVTEIARQLQQMHGLSYTPEVNNASFRDWGEDPYGGGWNSWNIGVKSWAVKEKITQPLNDVPLYICGEAYSDAQGWVEGALQTADIMLPKIMAKMGD